MSRAAVLGAGAWGTAFAKMLAEAGSEVTIWARREPVAAAIREFGVNESALPGVKLPERVTATSDLGAAVAGAGL
ncbi:MAG TPA: 2-dehydropantoate 2-reductase N-terminal domain-containing protein, partial [Actinoplanes sp.]